jgi:CDP-glucose 4,6-dehydratase
MDFSIFKNKKVLVTGHTGFKGSWLGIWLNHCGARVIGYALDPQHESDNYVLSDLANKIKDYRGDIRNTALLSKVFNDEQPEIIFHLAAQPLVIDSYENPSDTFEINVQGTVNVLEQFRLSSSAHTLIVITTDKVYENKNSGQAYKEEDRLGGADPYSASKAAAEIVTAAYQQSFFSNKQNNKHVYTVRAGNVVGGGDWSANRIIPDCIRAIENKEAIIIRNPKSVRPWQFVLEPLCGYLRLAEVIERGQTPADTAFNFGPSLENCVPVLDIVEKIIQYYGAGTYGIKNNGIAFKESTLLHLDASRAINELGWKAVLTLDETMEITASWYKHYREKNVYDLCLQQIDWYLSKWK